MRFTVEHFQAAADIVAREFQRAGDNPDLQYGASCMARAFQHLFASADPHFDDARFLRLCGEGRPWRAFPLDREPAQAPR